MSKLTDKDILNDKVGQYNLTTQGQDTDGELETKVYKVRNEESVSTCIAFFQPSMNYILSPFKGSPVISVTS